MSGHSKWSQIKRKKEIKDTQKGQLFSKLSRLITLAVKESGGITDPEKNIKLRLAITKAKEYNMPKENIKRAVEKAKGMTEAMLKEVVYEVFAPGGVSLIILAATDNPNRTLSEIRKVLDLYGGKLGSSGSVLYNFEKVGMVAFEKEAFSEEQLLQLVEILKVKDIDTSESEHVLYLPFEELGHVEKKIGQNFPKPAVIDIFYRPLTTVEISDKEILGKILSLVKALEELDDVHKVYDNCSISS